MSNHLFPSLSKIKAKYEKKISVVLPQSTSSTNIISVNANDSDKGGNNMHNAIKLGKEIKQPMNTIKEKTVGFEKPKEEGKSIK
jgi:hypothetical protein